MYSITYYFLDIYIRDTVQYMCFQKERACGVTVESTATSPCLNPSDEELPHVQSTTPPPLPHGPEHCRPLRPRRRDPCCLAALLRASRGGAARAARERTPGQSA